MNNTTEEQKRFKSMYKNDLAEMYGLSWRILRPQIYLFLPELKGSKKRKLLPHQVKKILSELPLD